MVEGYNYFGIVLYVNRHVMQIQFELHRPTTIFISKIYLQIKNSSISKCGIFFIIDFLTDWLR